jgi:hypothetical protein
MNLSLIPGRYDFSIPEAQRLSDLTGIDSDLEAVLRTSARCQKMAKGLSHTTNENAVKWWEDVQILGDLMFAAVVRYGRTLPAAREREFQRSGFPPYRSLCRKAMRTSRPFVTSILLTL